MVFVGIVQDSPPAGVVPGKDLLTDLLEREGIVSDEWEILHHLQRGDPDQSENLHPMPRGDIGKQKPSMVDELKEIRLDPCSHLEDALGKKLLVW